MNLLNQMMTMVDGTTESEMFLVDTNIIILIEDEYPLLYDVIDENDLSEALDSYVNFGKKIVPDSFSDNFIKQCMTFYPEELI